jgi:hypothetical protein
MILDYTITVSIGPGFIWLGAIALCLGAFVALAFAARE